MTRDSLALHNSNDAKQPRLLISEVTAHRRFTANSLLEVPDLDYETLALVLVLCLQSLQRLFIASLKKKRP